MMKDSKIHRQLTRPTHPTLEKVSNGHFILIFYTFKYFLNYVYYNYNKIW